VVSGKKNVSNVTKERSEKYFGKSAEFAHYPIFFVVRIIGVVRTHARTACSLNLENPRNLRATFYLREKRRLAGLSGEKSAGRSFGFSGRFSFGFTRKPTGEFERIAAAFVNAFDVVIARATSELNSLSER